MNLLTGMTSGNSGFIFNWGTQMCMARILMGKQSRKLSVKLGRPVILVVVCYKRVRAVERQQSALGSIL
jgi:hypothetical protein